MPEKGAHTEGLNQIVAGKEWLQQSSLLLIEDPFDDSTLHGTWQNVRGRRVEGLYR